MVVLYLLYISYIEYIRTRHSFTFMCWSRSSSGSV